MSDSFFSRWSRRKQEAVAQPTLVEPVQAPNAVPVPPPSPVQAAEAVPDAAPGGAPLPTLDDVQALTSGSDFQPFMQRGVGPEVRNAAMKKLFADPHFNVIDGLDIYIDDYSQPDPMPAGMLRTMASAQFLGLVPPEDPETASRAADPMPAKQVTEVVAQSPDASAHAEPQRHDHPDLQLQPDPAPADPTAGSRPGRGTD